MTERPPVLRRATPDDLDLLVQMNAEYCGVEGVPHDPARARAGFAPLLDSDVHGSVWMVHDDHGRVDGYCAIAHSWSVEIGGAEVVLDEIYVRSRGRGIGSRAITAVVDEMAGRGVKRVFLETERANARARALYARHGFAEDDSVWMSRVLDPPPASDDGFGHR